MAELRNRPRKELFQLRITPELRAKADDVGQRHNLGTTTATLSWLVERGIDFEAMVDRGNLDGPLLFELFAECRKDDPDAAARIVNALRKRFPLDELSAAVERCKASA